MDDKAGNTRSIRKVQAHASPFPALVSEIELRYCAGFRTEGAFWECGVLVLIVLGSAQSYISANLSFIHTSLCRNHAPLHSVLRSSYTPCMVLRFSSAGERDTGRRSCLKLLL